MSVDRLVPSSVVLSASICLALAACSGGDPAENNDDITQGGYHSGGTPASSSGTGTGNQAGTPSAAGSNPTGMGMAGHAGSDSPADTGGAPAMGGRSGGSAGSSMAGSGTAGSGPAPGECVPPVNPNATKQATNLLCYLYSQYGTHVLSGQQETSWSNPQGDISWYTSNGMKAPAIMGGDFLYPNGTTDRAIAYWKAGGIPMIRYHMGAPGTSDTYENSKGSANIDNVLKAGTSENNSFKSKLDYAAGELKKMQDQNVAVLWAPFHEVQQNGWFWWAKGSGAQFVGLWKYMFDYFTKTKGLNNLVWLMPYSGTPSQAHFPGKEYLDLSGPDTYDEREPFTGLFNNAKGIIGPYTPIPLHETGRIPTPSSMFPSAAPWVLFNIWSSYQKDGQHNTTANIKSVYEDAHTVTRDEVPNLK